MSGVSKDDRKMAVWITSTAAASVLPWRRCLSTSLCTLNTYIATRKLTEAKMTGIPVILEWSLKYIGVRGVPVPPTFWTEGYSTPHFSWQNIKTLVSPAVNKGDQRRLNYNKTSALDPAIRAHDVLTDPRIWWGGEGVTFSQFSFPRLRTQGRLLLLRVNAPSVLIALPPTSDQTYLPLHAIRLSLFLYHYFLTFHFRTRRHFMHVHCISSTGVLYLPHYFYRCVLLN